MKLRPIGVADDLEALVEELAPGFGGETEEARALLAQTLGLLTADPRPEPWGCYLAGVGPDTVGTCAFKSAPSEKGEVEIAYMTFPAFERRGHATAMAAALADIAFHAGVPTVIAHTLPEENASTRALRRNGFSCSGEVMDPEDGLVWRWARRDEGGGAA
ncbi:MAG TPA: GNAT family N-acetyltransferase [Allosphingosinicella sp.]